MNEKKEYYTIKEVSQMVGLTPQSIRRRLTTITTTKDLLFMVYGQYYIHHLLLWRFKRKRISNEFAYSLDFPKTYTNKDIDTIIAYLVNDFGSDSITIDYVIESKKKDQTPHIHAVVNTSNKRLFEKKVKILLGGNSYHIQAIYNKNKWLDYMRKVATITRKTNKKL
jgi:hypothetical protein